MAKMGKLTPEEESRNKMLMRERDRERKRMKRLNPEYRRMEQERDRDRKKARRANEAFRQLEKLRDKIRKERKKGIIHDEQLQADFANIPPVPVEPEVIIPCSITKASGQSTSRQRNNANAANMVAQSTANNNTNNSATSSATTTTATTTAVSAAAASDNNVTVPAAHMAQLNKGILYPPPNFAHHPLPIAGVTLMPQLCHPILHQNLSATLYPANGIKQEFIGNEQSSGTGSPVSGGQVPGGNAGGGGGGSGNGEEQEISLIEPEIILHTSTDVIVAPHHFQNHAHTHHLHQQQCGMFTHMTPQAHMSHMRALPPPPPATHAQQQQQQQAQQQMQHYAANKGS